HDRPARLPRLARHVLGADRNHGLGRQRDQQPQAGRRRRRHIRLAQGRARRAARRHGNLVLILAVWTCRLARARLPRPAGQSSSEPLLYRARGLALHHRARPRRGQRRSGGRARGGRGVGRPESRDRAPARGDYQRRFQSGNDDRPCPTGGSDSGAGPTPTPPAPDEPRRGRPPGPPATPRPPPRVAARARHTHTRRRNPRGDGRALARARRDSGMNYWPGFVDVLSTLILGIVFLLTAFVFVQFYLTQEVTGKDTALNRLNAQIAQLTELLSLEKTGK